MPNDNHYINLREHLRLILILFLYDLGLIILLVKLISNSNVNQENNHIHELYNPVAGASFILAILGTVFEIRDQLQNTESLLNNYLYSPQQIEKLLLEISKIEPNFEMLADIENRYNLNELICPITRTIMRDPCAVVDVSGYVRYYERRDITEWSNRCKYDRPNHPPHDPISRQQLQNIKTAPLRFRREMIERLATLLKDLQARPQYSRHSFKP